MDKFDVDFDQSKTLAPIPFLKPSFGAVLINGLQQGDPEFDVLTVRQLAKARATGISPAFPQHLPEWCDPAAVRRGQALHRSHFLCFLTGLTAGLLHGFVVGRFAQVLSMAGYTKDPWTTFTRYRDTSNHIFEWIAYDLFDNDSIARKSVCQVRAMHALARHGVSKQWAELAAADSHEIGVPLSQYDLGLVQMAFCAMTLSFVQLDCKLALTREERADYVHMWRYIGFLLGIRDEFNVAHDLETAENLFDEFLHIVPCLSSRARPCSRALVHGTIEGFGLYTFASKDFFRSLVYGAAHEEREFPLDATWTQVERPPAKYVDKIVRGLRPAEWWLPAVFWHRLFMMFVFLQSQYGHIMVYVVIAASYVPQALHI